VRGVLLGGLLLLLAAGGIVLTEVESDAGGVMRARPRPTHPRVFLTRTDIARIRARLASAQEPWTSAFGALMARADAALDARPRAVTEGGSGSRSHDYRTEPPYTDADGVVDADADRADYDAAVAVTSAVRDLGLAWAITRRAAYAEKALRLIHVWALDPRTRMAPRFTNGQSRIELSVTMPALVYGADLIWSHRGWTTRQRVRFVLWVRALLASARTWSADQNFENWRHALLATGGAFVRDGPSMRDAFQGFRAMLDGQMTARGEMDRETARSRSLFYSTFALDAMTQTAEVARLHGVDLWSYRTRGGKGLERALDFHAPYVVEPDRWPHAQITAYQGENAAIYELAWGRWAKPAHRRVIETWGRPMVEERVMGPVTLTHGERLR
jgi:hypothetical protein